MLMVRTTKRVSRIAGIGLIADQFIPKGAVVWEYHPGFDLLLSERDIGRLSAPAKQQVRNYAFLDRKYNRYLLCSDDARFFNHSSEPNCDDGSEDVTVAIRDIAAGEELTVDYRTFYGDIDDHPEVLSEGRSMRAQ
jgi:hypothetical protein